MLRRVNLGWLKGSLAVSFGGEPYLLLLGTRGLALTRFRRNFAKRLAYTLGSRAIIRLYEARKAVKLSKLDLADLREELGKLMREGSIELVGFLLSNWVAKVELKRGRLGRVKIYIHKTNGEKVSLKLIFGLGSGIDRDEAISLAKRLFKEANLKLKEEL